MEALISMMLATWDFSRLEATSRLNDHSSLKPSDHSPEEGLESQM